MVDLVRIFFFFFFVVVVAVVVVIMIVYVVIFCFSRYSAFCKRAFYRRVQCEKTCENGEKRFLFVFLFFFFFFFFF